MFVFEGREMHSDVAANWPHAHQVCRLHQRQRLEHEVLRHLQAEPVLLSPEGAHARDGVPVRRWPARNVQLPVDQELQM